MGKLQNRQIPLSEKIDSYLAGCLENEDRRPKTKDQRPRKGRPPRKQRPRKGRHPRK